MAIRNPDNPLFTIDTPPCRESVHAYIAALGKEFTPRRFQETYERIYSLFELKGSIFAEEIEAIADEMAAQPELGWDLISLKTTIGPNVLPAAMVVLRSPEGQKVTAEAAGNSSIDAICQAITEATGIRIFLKDFNYSTLGSGLNSLGQASITVEYHNRQVRTKACSTDMLEAAAKVYLMAINIILDRINRQLD